MYLGIDIGGTKTLVATIDDNAVIVERHKFPTPKDYDSLLQSFKEALESFKTKSFAYGGIGVPGSIDRQNGISLGSPNVAWGNEPLQADSEKIFGCAFVIENDANMAALSEAMLRKDCSKVLYFTVSTGIGTGLVYNQVLDPGMLESEGGHIRLPHDDKIEDWEDFASGRAIYAHFGKKAADITDENDWKTIAHNLGLGFFAHIAILQPDLIVVGGSIGTYFDNYGKYLLEELKSYAIPITPIPEIIKAQRPEEAVIFGCYELAKQVQAHGKTD